METRTQSSILYQKHGRQ